MEISASNLPPVTAAVPLLDARNDPQSFPGYRCVLKFAARNAQLADGIGIGTIRRGEQ